jgi:hypothetical protein
MAIYKNRPLYEGLQYREQNTGKGLVTYFCLIITMVVIFMMLLAYSSVSAGNVKKNSNDNGTPVALSASGLAPSFHAERQIKFSKTIRVPEDPEENKLTGKDKTSDFEIEDVLNQNDPISFYL